MKRLQESSFPFRSTALQGVSTGEEEVMEVYFPDGGTFVLQGKLVVRGDVGGFDSIRPFTVKLQMA